MFYVLEIMLRALYAILIIALCVGTIYIFYFIQEEPKLKEI